ncbi:helix-turn-helix domain-containing protein [Tabrizicola sp.]|uniref:helix-turn-helix domain-containing protein n=1 Tax=Tabrizicola sp. TaxID=2005166 RepID=UPI003F3BEFC3
MLDPSFGDLLRQWRQRRALSQLALSGEAEISQRHLSFLESGRSTPSREMVLRLADGLDVPLRERNLMLSAAGFAPVYRERTLDDPDMVAARQAVAAILKGHEPFPALAIDRHWHLMEANASVGPLLAGVDPALLASPVNVLRLSLHQQGLAPRVANYREWRTHILARLDRQIALSADPVLATLRDELAGYPVPPGNAPWRPGTTKGPSIAVPFVLETDAGRLSFLSATTVFGTAVDISLAELAIEAFLPADQRTADFLMGRRHG